MAVLEPDLAVLDETDSGLDIDALKVVASGVGEVRAARPAARRAPDNPLPADPGAFWRRTRVHLLVNGRIVESGGPELARRLEEEGYEAWR